MPCLTGRRNLSGLVIVVVTILAMNDNKNSASFVFSDFVNLTGFSDSYTAILGLLQAAFGMWYVSASTTYITLLTQRTAATTLPVA